MHVAISRARRRPRVSTTPVFALATEGQRDRGARREGTPADWTASGWPSRGVVRPTLSTPPARLLLWVPRPIATTRSGAVALVGLLAPLTRTLACTLRGPPTSPISPGRAGPHRAQRSARVPSPGGGGCALSAPAPRARTYRPPGGGPAGTVCVTGAAGSLARAPAGVCVARFSAMLVMVMHPQVRGAPALRPGTVLLSIRGPLSRGVPPTLARPTECIGGKKVAHSQSLLGGRPALRFSGASLGYPSVTACPRVR